MCFTDLYKVGINVYQGFEWQENGSIATHHVGFREPRVGGPPARCVQSFSRETSARQPGLPQLHRETRLGTIICII